MIKSREINKQKRKEKLEVNKHQELSDITFVLFDNTNYINK